MTQTQTTSQKIPKLRFSEFFGEWEEKKLGEANKIKGYCDELGIKVPFRKLIKK